MKGIIKSQIYLMKRLSMLRTMGIGLVAFNMVLGYLEILNNPGQTISKAIAVFDEVDMMNSGLVVMMVALVASLVAGHDFEDKSINYELLSGHTRRQIFFGRALPAIAISTIFGALEYISGYLIMIPFASFGDTVELSAVLLRFMLILLVFVRVACIAIMLVFILSSWGNGYVVSMFVFGMEIIGMVFLGNGMPYLLSVSNIFRLRHFVGFQTYRIDDLQKIYGVYDAMPKLEEVAGTVGVSALVAVLCLGIGYSFFHKEDMR